MSYRCRWDFGVKEAVEDCIQNGSDTHTHPYKHTQHTYQAFIHRYTQIYTNPITVLPTNTRTYIPSCIHIYIHTRFDTFVHSSEWTRIPHRGGNFLLLNRQTQASPTMSWSSHQWYFKQCWGSCTHGMGRSHLRWHRNATEKHQSFQECTEDWRWKSSPCWYRGLCSVWDCPGFQTHFLIMDMRFLDSSGTGEMVFQPRHDG